MKNVGLSSAFEDESDLCDCKLYMKRKDDIGQVETIEWFQSNQAKFCEFGFEA